MGQGGQRGEGRANLGRGEAVLGLFAGNVDLEKPVDFLSGFAGDAVDRSGQCLAVDAVEKGKKGKGLADFVFLQMAEEVPFESRRAGRDFFPCFLHAVLAEDSLACGGSGLDGPGGVRFGNRDEADAVRFAPGPPGGDGDLPPGLGQTGGDVGH